MFYSYGPNRYICDVLKEMRECIKTANFSYLSGLIEEAQTMANRMEAALTDAKDIRELAEDRSKKNKEMKVLYEEIKKLEERKEQLEKDIKALNKEDE